MRAASVAVDAHNVLLASMRKPRNFGDHEAAKKFTRDRRKARATHRPARVVHLNKCVLLHECVSAFYSACRCNYYRAKNPTIDNELLSMERVLLQ